MSHRGLWTRLNYSQSPVLITIIVPNPVTACMSIIVIEMYCKDELEKEM